MCFVEIHTGRMKTVLTGAPWENAWLKMSCAESAGAGVVSEERYPRDLSCLPASVPIGSTRTDCYP